MKDRIPTNPGRVLITPENGAAPYYATMARADDPAQEGTPLNKNTFLKDETAVLFGLGEEAVPDDALKAIAAMNWKQLAEFSVAGAYTFTVPDGVNKLGILLLGGGGSGGVANCYNSSDNSASATGGGSGEIKQVVLSKDNGDFSPGDVINVVVGAGGAPVSATPSGNGKAGNNGGSSSFGDIVAAGGNCGNATCYSSSIPSNAGSDSSEGGGQPSDYVDQHQSYSQYTLKQPAPFGLISYAYKFDNSQYILSYKSIRGSEHIAHNVFDDTDVHEYCGAGGAAWCWYKSIQYNNAQATVERAKGHAGAGAYSFANDFYGNPATAPGDGGGGVAGSLSSSSAKLYSGAGHDGLVLVYGGKI